MSSALPPASPEALEPLGRPLPVRGPAWLAESARRALGVSREVAVLPDAPAPFFCGAVAVAAGVLCVLVRPQALGYRNSLLLDLAIIAVACLAVGYHARLVCPPGAQPAVHAAVLPAAALLALAVVLASISSIPIGAAAVAGAAVVITLVPYLDARRVAGRELGRERVLRDAVGVGTVAPLVLLGAAPWAPWAARLPVVFAGGSLIAVDAIRREAVSWRTTLTGAAAVGALTTAAVMPAGRLSQATGATGLLLLWYGLRGIVGTVAARRRGLVLVEYAVFVAAAIVVLAGLHRPR